MNVISMYRILLREVVLRKKDLLFFITPLSVQISASNFHDFTQITQRRVCFNPRRTEKPKAHVFLCALVQKSPCTEVWFEIWLKAHGKFSVRFESQISTHTSPQGDVCTKSLLLDAALTQEKFLGSRSFSSRRSKQERTRPTFDSLTLRSWSWRFST